MADNWGVNTPGYSEILSPLEIKNRPDQPVVDSRHVRGGGIAVETVADLASIPKSVLKKGVSVVYVAETGKRYEPVAIPANSDPVIWALVEAGGAGDMEKTIYDPDNNGVVNDSQRLGGQLPAFYATDLELAAVEAAAIAADAAEAAARIAADNALATADATEKAARIAADNALANGLTSEAQTRQQADSTLAQGINAEATARQAADTALAQADAAEATARASADTALANRATALELVSHQQNTDTGTDKQAFDIGAPAKPGDPAVPGTTRTIAAKGSATNIELVLQPKGTGKTRAASRFEATEVYTTGDFVQDNLPKPVSGADFPTAPLAPVAWNAQTDKYLDLTTGFGTQLVHYVHQGRGNDTLAAAGDASRPYATITAAYNACPTGGLVHVLSGDHPVPFNTYLKAIHWYFAPGTVVRDSGANATPSGYNFLFRLAPTFVSEGDVRINGTYPAMSVAWFQCASVRFNTLSSTGGIAASYFTPSILTGVAATVRWTGLITDLNTNIFDWVDRIDIRYLSVDFNNLNGTGQGLSDAGSQNTVKFFRLGHLEIKNHTGTATTRLNITTGGQFPQLYFEVTSRLLLENIAGFINMGSFLHVRFPVVLVSNCPAMKLQLNNLTNFSGFGFAASATLRLGEWPFPVELLSNSRYDCTIEAERLGAIVAANFSNQNQLGGKLRVKALECGPVSIDRAFIETTLDVRRINGPVGILYSGGNGAAAAAQGFLSLPGNTHIRQADVALAAITLDYNENFGVTLVRFINGGNVTSNSTNAAPFRFLRTIAGGAVLVEPFANDPKHTTKGYFIDGSGTVTLETGGLPSRGIYHLQPAI